MPGNTEEITAKTFPMLYLPRPIKAQELISKIQDVSIVKISNDYPLTLIKRGGASELRSYTTPSVATGYPSISTNAGTYVEGINPASQGTYVEGINPASHLA